MKTDDINSNIIKVLDENAEFSNIIRLNIHYKSNRNEVNISFKENKNYNIYDNENDIQH